METQGLDSRRRERAVLSSRSRAGLVCSCETLEGRTARLFSCYKQYCFHCAALPARQNTAALLTFTLIVLPRSSFVQPCPPRSRSGLAYAAQGQLRPSSAEQARTRKAHGRRYRARSGRKGTQAGWTSPLSLGGILLDGIDRDVGLNDIHPATATKEGVARVARFPDSSTSATARFFLVALRLSCCPSLARLEKGIEDVVSLCQGAHALAPSVVAVCSPRQRRLSPGRRPSFAPRASSPTGPSRLTLPSLYGFSRAFPASPEPCR